MVFHFKNRKLFFLAFFLITIKLGICQQDSETIDIFYIDGKVQEIKSDSLKITTFHKLIKEHVIIKDLYSNRLSQEHLVKYKSLLLENLELSREVKFKERDAIQYIVYYYLRFEKDYDLALQYLMQKKKMTSDISLIAKDYVLIGEVYQDKNNYDSTFYYYKKAIFLLDSLKEFSALNKQKLKLAKQYIVALNDTLNARKYLHEVLAFDNPLIEVEEIRLFVEAYYYLGGIEENSVLKEKYLKKSYDLMLNQTDYNPGGIFHFMKVLVLIDLIEIAIKNHSIRQSKKLIDSLEFCNIPDVFIPYHLSVKAKYFSKVNINRDSALVYYQLVIENCNLCTDQQKLEYNLAYLNQMLVYLESPLNNIKVIDSLFERIELNNEQEEVKPDLKRIDNEFKEQKIKNLQLESKVAQLEIRKKNTIIVFTVLFSIVGLIIILLVFRSRKVKAENIRLRSKGELLQTIINPHFVANSLGAVQGMIISENKEVAVDVIADMGSVMRELFEFSQKDVISFQQELNFLKKYVRLKKSRHSELEINIINNVNREKEIFIPPMLLQPIVENSIKYGLEVGEENNIEIIFHLKKSKILAVVKNRGELKEKKQRRDSALKIIKERLQYLEQLHQNKFRFDMKQEKGDNVVVMIEIPYE